MQLDLIDAIEARKQADAGMTQAAEHADEVAPGWTDIAYTKLFAYARTHARFISEDATAAIAAEGFSAPVTGKSWGAVFQKAARNGVIRKDGFGVSKRRNLSPTPMWVSRIFQGERQ